MHKTRSEIAYPDVLRNREARLVSRRRGYFTDSDEEALAEATKPIGIAVSGGGVRSATFALGVFQAFAAKGFLRRVDYLSTVSGGGYFGGFLASLFARKEPDRRKRVLTPEQRKQEGRELVESTWRDVETRLATSSREVQYLRENGRYLAPAGSDDLWLGASVLIRNWVALQLVLASAALFVWEILELLMYRARWSELALSAGVRDVLETAERFAAKHGLTLSPLWVLPPLLVALGSLPLGWAYWLAGYGRLARFVRHFLRWAVKMTAFGRNRAWIEGQYTAIDDFDRWLMHQPKLGTFACAGVCCAIIDHVWLADAQVLNDVAWPAGLALWVTCAAYAAETVSYRGTRDHRAFSQIMVLMGFLITAATYLCAFALAHYAIYDFRFGAVGRDGRPAPQVLIDVVAQYTPASLLAMFDLLKQHTAAWLLIAFDLVMQCTPMLLLITVAFTVLRLLMGQCYRMLVQRRQEWLFPNDGELGPEDEQHFSRHSVSYWLMRITFLCSAFALVALVHTAGMTLYVRLGQDAAGFLSSVLTALLTVAALGRKASLWLAGPRSDRRPPWFGTLLAYIAGYGLLLSIMIVLSAVACLFVYGGAIPIELTVKAAFLEYQVRVPLVPNVDSASYSLLALGLISVVFGSSHLFLNSSTHLPLYASRITRTFLGASNPKRTEQAPAVRTRDGDKTLLWSALGMTKRPEASEVASGKAATQLMPGDDIATERYWSTAENGPYDRGAPLHIINVTINETVDGRSQTQQSDRKGLGLAIGPCGLSAGVRHHAALDWSKPVDCEMACGGASFVVFNYDENLLFHELWLQQRVRKLAEQAKEQVKQLKDKGLQQHVHDLWANRGLKGAKDSDPPLEKRDFEHVEFAGEGLTIGQWLGISGAAFTTGLGFRTNSGLSLLAGLANIRLGYWWDSGVNRPWSLRRMVGIFFWTHHYLRRELLARFPGTANRLWYLSDGGHFENTGAYELIRRELPFIVVLDAEEDPEYGLEGLGNLVRKARLDFGAEITFLDNDEIDGCAQLSREVRKHVGSLSELARGDWERTDALHLPPRDEVQAKQHRLTSADVKKRSIAHASLARITYASVDSDGEHKDGLLLYIKPTLTGDEPADVLRYHAEHPAFPHEPTLDQFFAESQWESYRSLGQHIGERLCSGELGPFRQPGRATNGVHAPEHGANGEASAIFY